MARPCWLLYQRSSNSYSSNVKYVQADRPLSTLLELAFINVVVRSSKGSLRRLPIVHIETLLVYSLWWQKVVTMASFFQLIYSASICVHCYKYEHYGERLN